MSNPVTEALIAYYRTQYVEDEDSPDYDEEALFFEYGIPLEERSSGIMKILDRLLAEGVDLNDAPDGEYPLMYAVIHMDAQMTGYLIRNGADCRKWSAEGEEPEWYEDNWYLVDLDVTLVNHLLNRAFYKAALETAYVLVKDGGLQEPFYGNCVEINDKREVICSSLKLKY